MLELGQTQFRCTKIRKPASKSQQTRVLLNEPNIYYFDVKYHWLREKVKAKDVELKYISTHDQVADILTKSLGERQHTKLRSALTGF